MNQFADLRKKAGYTQAEAARQLGIKQGTVAMWENGSNQPTSSRLIQIAKLYNCSIDQLLGRGSQDE